MYRTPSSESDLLVFPWRTTQVCQGEVLREDEREVSSLHLTHSLGL